MLNRYAQPNLVDKFQNLISKSSSKKERGFTLPELLVAVFLFTLAIGGAINLVLSAFSIQRNAITSEHLLSQGSYLAEYMARALRQARKDLNSPPNNCLQSAKRGVSYEINAQGTRIRFVNRDGLCQEFFLSGSTIQERRSQDGSANNFGPPVALTSNNLIAESLKFALRGEVQTDNLQPRVTFVMRLRTVGAKPESQNIIQLQTSVSQRIFDVEL